MGRDGPIARERGPEGGASAPVSGAALRIESRTLLEERDAWTVLASIHGLGPVTLGSLLRRFGSGRGILSVARRRGGRAALTARAGPNGEPEVTRISADLAARIVEHAERGDDVLEAVSREGLVVVTLEDAAFPARLLAIEMPPHVLFVRGDPAVLSSPSAVAVVGTRRPSDYGRRVAARIAGSLARQGTTVVSGLAVGIDGAAHAACVAEHRPTLAVLGGGHRHLFPQAHRRLADAIVDSGGAVVSELPPDASPTRGTFPRRNRLISGLADATVVVEAAAQSGALITASWALEQGRPCFLVPGAIDSPTVAGSLAFLRAYPEAARIVAGVPQLLEDLGLAPADPAPGEPARPTPAERASKAPTVSRESVLSDLGGSERAVAEALVAGRSTADELVATTELPIASVLGVLTLLEMRGLAVAAYGRYRPAGLLASS